MDHEDYSDILEDIIDCCFYSNVKPRIKISHFRQLTEILIRKLLSIDKNKKIMLGNSDLKENLHLTLHMTLNLNQHIIKSRV